MAGPSEPASLRVLVLAPTGRDAALSLELLAGVGIEGGACSSADELAAEVARGAGALLLAEEALEEPGELGQLPDHFEVRDPARECEQVARSVAEHLVREVDVARADEVGLRHGHGSIQSHACQTRGMADTCTHLDLVGDVTPSSEGCEDCLRIGAVWVHLRMCMTCGHVGCCDQSPNRHATAHYQASGHPLIRSLERGEVWSWCYVDEVGLRIPEVHGTTRIPPSPLGG